MKSESIAEFLARGGKVTICPKAQAKGGKRKPRAQKEQGELEVVNYDIVPTNLKIALGLK